MTRSPLILALCLTLPAACAAAAVPQPGRVTCLSAPGVDAGLAAAFCDALRGQAPDHDIRAHVLMAGPAGLGVRLDLVTAQGVRPGTRLDLSVMDRDISPADLRGFARDSLRYSPDQPI